MAVLRIHSEIINEEKRIARLVCTGINGVSFSTIDSFLYSIPENDKKLEIRINCCGGETTEGWAIYDKIRSSGKEITTIIEGTCASMASVLLLTAPKERRFAYPNSQLCIHEAFVQPAGLILRSKDLVQIAEDLERDNENILNLYVERTGADKVRLQALMKEDKYISMEEAKELGFISAILPPLSASKKNHLNTINMAKVENVEVKKSLFEKLMLKCGYSKIEDAENALCHLALDLTTAEGNILTIEREEGDPQVGDKASPDGEHLMPDGTTIVVVDGVIAEIKNPENPDENEKEELAQAKARIQELEQEIALLRPQAKSQEELVILNKVKIMGGMEGLRKIASKYVPDGRGFVENRGTSASSQEPASLVEKRLAERQEALKKKFNK